MASIVKIDGVNGVLTTLGKKLHENGGVQNVIVGFQTNYAIHVHENLEVYHKVGQAKYLEQPARQYQKELGLMIVSSMMRGMSLKNALFAAGLRLQREAQLLVPVDTGLLKNSAFTEYQHEPTPSPQSG